MHRDKKSWPLAVIPSVLAGILVPILYLLNQGSPLLVIMSYREVSPFHFGYGLFFLLVLFWVGFVAAWSANSFLLWFVTFIGSTIKRVVLNR
ncbi:MAG: hypothetical protein JXD19_00215 [Deltaproteobacteria bacterium]|nr:hypothetical protein [Deltaproteobacteria bacterium]